MTTIRKVFYKLAIFTCFTMMVMTPGCGQGGLAQSLPTAKIDNSYVSYKVGSVSSYAENTSRNSAVRVEIESYGATVRGTGTYFKYKGHSMVVTAAHLFVFEVPTVLKSEAIITTPHEKVIGTLVYLDTITDIAVFKVTTLDNRKPARFNRTPAYTVGQDIVYSGFPGGNNLLTFQGVIIGQGYGTDLAIQSFAWGGSSGSGVFDENGRFVGVLVSIMVGPGYQGPQLLGSIAYIAPANLIDSVYLRYNLDKMEVLMNDGF